MSRSDDDGGVSRTALHARINGDDQDFKELVAMASEAGIPIEELIGSQTQSCREQFTVPLVLTYEDETKRVVYRRGDGMGQLFSGPPPRNSTWIESDARMTLKKALASYGEDLLAYERVQSVTNLEVIGATVRKRVEITTRVLVRKTGKSS